MDPEQQSSSLLAPTLENIASVKVFPLIPALKKDVTNTIDSALTWDQLTAADINFSIIRPMVNKYARLKNMAVVYACLVVRSYFLSESVSQLAFAGVMLSRANLCEILAYKLLGRFATNYIQLVAVLATSWSPLAGATPEIIHEVKQNLGVHDDDVEPSQCALEMAISTDAKTFLSSPVTQKVVNDIYNGTVVFSHTARRSILADNYKPRAIEIYDPQRAPFLDHYRLKVPKYGNYFEFLKFALLLLTFVLCLSTQDSTKLTPWEVAFLVFGSAFVLEEYTASMEHGWIIYIANMWKVFDFSFIVIFFVYLGLRIKGLSSNNLSTSNMAFDVLSCGASILFPRLAFFAVSNHVIVLSLRAMISQFVFFIGMAAICFSGLLFTLWTLARNESERHSSWSIKSIAWLMVQIWFGNTSLSFAQASSFHPLLGPILMTIFAALSNTLLLTILICILSNTVARIDENATQEYLYQFTISTLEGRKSDALFSYQPPFNILALLILKPASWFLTPRALHTVNVFLIKLTSLPYLIIIGSYERYLAGGRKIKETGKDAAHSFYNSLPRHIKNIPLVEALVGSSSNDLYDAIFDVEVEEDFDIFDDSDDDAPVLRSFDSRENIRASGTSPAPKLRIQQPSSTSRAGPSPKDSPRRRVLSTLSAAPEGATSSGRSPLSRLFNPRFPSDGQGIGEASLKRIETLLDDVRELPVQRLKEEMKELQDRQARIENLLLMLTRGMRNETHKQGTVDSHKQGTL